MECNYCDAKCIRKGFYKETQRFYCKSCKRYQQSEYLYKRFTEEMREELIVLNKEGMSMSSISRKMGISKTNVLNKIKILSGEKEKPVLSERQQEYEMDELRTYTGNKRNECWVIYAMNKMTKKVVDFTVGRRTKENIKKVLNALMRLDPKRIFTDRLNIYETLIDKNIHVALPYGINHIERKNLDLRKDLKCLNRRTICYSKSEKMLAAKLQLYFFG